MTRRKTLDIMMPVVSGLACAVSAYTTQQGLATATSDLLVSVGVALTGGAFLFVFSLFLMWRFPYADSNHQIGYGIVAFVVMVLAFGFSTQWSVIAMGGKDALSIHMQRVLDQADFESLRLLRQATLEANLAPQLASLGQQYEDLASRETRGAFSGLRGEGSVVATLRNMSQMFANLSRTVKGVDGEKKALYDSRQLAWRWRRGPRRQSGVRLARRNFRSVTIEQYGSRAANASSRGSGRLERPPGNDAMADCGRIAGRASTGARPWYPAAV